MISFAPTRAERNYKVAPYYGKILYVHGVGIDAPLAIYKDNTSTMVTPVQDLSGKFVGGVCHGTCNYSIYSPEAAGSHYSILGQLPNGPPSWYGRIIESQQDASGLQYKRNRYYDPQSGKFTQEDPIGLAGGLNVYGFANGDPASYSDPFGLCPRPDGTDDGLPCNADNPEALRGAMAQIGARGPAMHTAILGFLPIMASIAAGGNAMLALGRGLLAAAPAIPALSQGSGREMLGQALGYLKDMVPTERVAAFANFSQQIESATQGSWQSAQLAATNATIFAGKAGEALVFDAAGPRKYRKCGRVRDGKCW